jgi:hypothetical protein
MSYLNGRCCKKHAVEQFGLYWGREMKIWQEIKVGHVRSPQSNNSFI